MRFVRLGEMVVDLEKITVAKVVHQDSAGKLRVLSLHFGGSKDSYLIDDQAVIDQLWPLICKLTESTGGGPE